MPFSGPETPSAKSILSSLIRWGSGGSSSWAPLMLRPASVGGSPAEAGAAEAHRGDKDTGSRSCGKYSLA